MTSVARFRVASNPTSLAGSSSLATAGRGEQRGTTDHTPDATARRPLAPGDVHAEGDDD